MALTSKHLKWGIAGLALLAFLWYYLPCALAILYNYYWWIFYSDTVQYASPVTVPEGIEPTVPKILHQTWKTKELPEKWKAAQQSCIDKHPGYEYKLWTDDDAEQVRCGGRADSSCHIEASSLHSLHLGCLPLCVRRTGRSRGSALRVLRGASKLLLKAAWRHEHTGTHASARMQPPRCSGLPHCSQTTCNLLCTSSNLLPPDHRVFWLLDLAAHCHQVPLVPGDLQGLPPPHPARGCAALLCALRVWRHLPGGCAKSWCTAAHAAGEVLLVNGSAVVVRVCGDG